MCLRYLLLCEKGLQTLVAQSSKHLTDSAVQEFRNILADWFWLRFFKEVAIRAAAGPAVIRIFDWG